MHLLTFKDLLKDRLSKQFNSVVSSIELIPVGGGCINDCYEIRTNNGQKLFLKINSATGYPLLFEKEKNGLNYIGSKKCIATPSVLLCENYDDKQMLVLHWIEGGIRDQHFWQKFGEQLARLHNETSEFFGFEEDNYMGSLPQENTPTKSWTDFFIQYRLQPQAELAMQRKMLETDHLRSFEQLYKKLDAIYNQENPSLLHGDLWSGNFMCNEDSNPVLIDPAVYFGHPSVDLGMTTLFGGFDKSFYDAYNHHAPFTSNYREQWEVSNLYPLLIHLNLFGKSYLSDIVQTLKRFA